jgi:hypothetical protein
MRVTARASVAAGVAAVALAVLAAPALAQDDAGGVAAAPEASRPDRGVRCVGVGDRVGALLATDQPLDAHLAALAAETLCPEETLPAARLWDAVALVRLEELDRARAMLDRLSLDPHLGATARVAKVWSFLESGDTRAFRAALPALPPAPAARLAVLDAARREADVARLARRLDASLAASVIDRYRHYRRARSKRPWLAGTLSALVPGLGQAYDGSWQSAALSLAINAVLIGGTVELARNRLYFASATTGLAASMFYVGNILNAADLARRYNQRASEPHLLELERLLVPEVIPSR